MKEATVQDVLYHWIITESNTSDVHKSSFQNIPCDLAAVIFHRQRGFFCAQQIWTRLFPLVLLFSDD